MTASSRFTAILMTASFLAVGVASAFAQDATTNDPPPAAGTADERPYLQENDAAMVKMMNDMAVKPSGDTNRDFVEMMIPHHQGAIDMAVAYLRYGNNEQLKRIAQEIIVDQQQEIAAMRMALGDPLPASDAAPTQADANAAADTSSSDEKTSSQVPAMRMMMMMKPAN